MAFKCSTVGEGEFKLILPLFDNSGKKINSSEYNHYLRRMNERFGGTSSYRVSGCFVNEKGKRECEGNILVTSIRDFDSPYDKKQKFTCSERKKQIEDDYKFLIKLAREARKEFGQESILAIYDKIQEATLVKGERKESLPQHKVLLPKQKYEKFKEVF